MATISREQFDRTFQHCFIDRLDRVAIDRQSVDSDEIKNCLYKELTAESDFKRVAYSVSAGVISAGLFAMARGFSHRLLGGAKDAGGLTTAFYLLLECSTAALTWRDIDSEGLKTVTLSLSTILGWIISGLALNSFKVSPVASMLSGAALVALGGLGMYHSS